MKFRQLCPFLSIVEFQNNLRKYQELGNVATTILVIVNSPIKTKATSCTTQRNHVIFQNVGIQIVPEKIQRHASLVTHVCFKRTAHSHSHYLGDVSTELDNITRQVETLKSEIEEMK